jgi:DNA-binding GntR family transcriptional regulator
MARKDSGQMEARADDLPESLARHVASRLADEIEAGRYQPGERLSEVGLAQEFGISRGPVREALRMLAGEELVNLQPRRGAFVIDFTPEEIDELFEVRSAIYSLATRLFARRAKPGQIAALAELIAEIRLLADRPETTPAEFARATQASTAYLVAHCGNRRVQAMMRRMTRQAFRHFAMRAHLTVQRRQETATAALAGMEALRSGNVDLAAEISRQVVEANHRAVLNSQRTNCPTDGKRTLR